MFKSFEKRDRGFVILMATLISGILLTIGVAISNFSIKQQRLSSSGKQNLISWYNSFSGMECFLENIDAFYELDSSPTTAFDCSPLVFYDGTSGSTVSSRDINGLENDSSPSPSTLAEEKLSLSTANPGSDGCFIITAKVESYNSGGPDNFSMRVTGYNRCEIDGSEYKPIKSLRTTESAFYLDF